LVIPVARRTPQTFLKRKREQKRAEKARQKEAKREARKAGLVPMDVDPYAEPDESVEETDDATS
jgi:hypothetical protein